MDPKNTPNPPLPPVKIGSPTATNNKNITTLSVPLYIP